ncbi:MAG: hypothetical protein ABIP46_09060 [Polaromonas sp.]
MNCRSIASLVVLTAFCTAVHAQKPGAEPRIRAQTSKALDLFFDSGATGLQKTIESCYATAQALADRERDPEASVERELSNERCVALDHLGLILFVTQKRMMETRFKKTFDDPFFNPQANEKRVAEYLELQKFDEIKKKKFSEFVFGVVYDQYRKQLAARSTTSTEMPVSK